MEMRLDYTHYLLSLPTTYHLLPTTTYYLLPTTYTYYLLPHYLLRTTTCARLTHLERQLDSKAVQAELFRRERERSLETR